MVTAAVVVPVAVVAVAVVAVVASAVVVAAAVAAAAVVFSSIQLGIWGLGGVPLEASWYSSHAWPCLVPTAATVEAWAALSSICNQLVVRS